MSDYVTNEKLQELIDTKHEFNRGGDEHLVHAAMVELLKWRKAEQFLFDHGFCVATKEWVDDEHCRFVIYDCPEGRQLMGCDDLLIAIETLQNNPEFLRKVRDDR